MPISHIVGKIPDKKIIALIEAVEAEFGLHDKHYRYGNIPIDPDEIETLRKTASATYIISSTRLIVADNIFSISINRNPDKIPSAYYDEIVIAPQTSGKTLTAKQALRLEEVVRSNITFPKISPASGDTGTVGLIEKQIAAMADLHEKMISETASVRVDLERQYAESLGIIAQKKAKDEEEIKERELASRERISKEQKELDERSKEFDASDHQRARRRQREEISAQVQKFLDLPQGTVSTRAKFIGLISGIFAISIVAGYFSFYTLSQFSTISQGLNVRDGFSAEQNITYILWMLGIRGAILSIISVGLGLYAIKLLRNSHDEELNYQRELRRYGMDINRASWVIETAMEMTTKEGAVLPEKWIEGTVSGLFQSTPKQDAEVTPLAALGAILSLGPEMSVGPGGASFKIPSKGTKQAAKEGE